MRWRQGKSRAERNELVGTKEYQYLVGRTHGRVLVATLAMPSAEPGGGPPPAPEPDPSPAILRPGWVSRGSRGVRGG
eukprot:COSAG06_NODE_46034_length_350_cov_0.613546_1_plen_76_part_01